MKDPLVILGVGQLGSLFQTAFEQLGQRVVPVTRHSNLKELAARDPNPSGVLVAVGEDALGPALSSLPAGWRSNVILLQNELRPAQWLRAGIATPTVLIVWFERKQGLPPQAVRESVVCGPAEPRLSAALRPLGLEPKVIASDALAFELCLKNLYILTLNLCGLGAIGPAGALLKENFELFTKVRSEVFSVERGLFEPNALGPEAALFSRLEDAILADPAHGTAGRTAPRRLARTLAHADLLGLEVPTLRDLAIRHLT